MAFIPAALNVVCLTTVLVETRFCWSIDSLPVQVVEKGWQCCEWEEQCGQWTKRNGTKTAYHTHDYTSVLCRHAHIVVWLWVEHWSVESLSLWWPNSGHLPLSHRQHAIYIMSPGRATLFPGRGSYEYDQIRVSLCWLCLGCLGLLSCVFFCVVWFCL